MKTILLISIMVFSSVYRMSAQTNLVLNSGFEEHTDDFRSIDMIDFIALHWWRSTGGTPDYYHAKHYDPSVRIPKTFNGTIYPRSGNACMGILLFYAPDAQIESISGELSDTLVAGKRYEVSFWVKCAKESSQYFSYNIGIRFTNKKEDAKNITFISKKSFSGIYLDCINPEYTADVQNQYGKYIKDSSWVQIRGEYIAKGDEKYFTIGPFWDDNPKIVKAWKKVNPNYDPNDFYIRSKSKCRHFAKIYARNALIKNPNKTLWKKGIDNCAYYVIDDVCVEEIK